MTLAEAKTALESLPGVHEVTEFVVRDDLDAMPVYVRLNIYCTNPDLLPEDTLRDIHENLTRDLNCMIFINLKFDKS